MSAINRWRSASCPGSRFVTDRELAKKTLPVDPLAIPERRRSLPVDVAFADCLGVLTPRPRPSSTATR